MFNHFISLGCNCSVPASLRKLGLRDASYPFDWNITIFTGVIRCIDTHFSDLLLIDNLELDSIHPTHFTDKLYGTCYMHEMLPGDRLQDKLPEIRNKYLRRIDRFYNITQTPTCFIRLVLTTDEINYINENYPYIEEVLQRTNKENTLIFILPKNKISSTPIINFPNYYYVSESRHEDYRTGQLISRNSELEKYILNSIAPI